MSTAEAHSTPSEHLFTRSKSAPAAAAAAETEVQGGPSGDLKPAAKIVRNAFMDVLSEIPVVTVSATSSSSSGAAGQDVTVVSIECTLERIMDTLHSQGILSVPVVNASNHAVGFVDVLDIVEYIVSALKQTKSTVDTVQFLTTLMSTPASTLVDFSRRDHYVFESGAQDLASIAKTLSTGLVHRVCTGRKFGDPVLKDVPLSICSQFDLISVLSSELRDDASKSEEGRSSSKLKAMADLPLMDLLGQLVEKKKRNLCLILSSATLLDACAQLIDENVSVVGIVDIETGRLIGSFSAADFANWTKDDFHLFIKPALDFLHAKSASSLNPVTISAEASLGQVIHICATTKSHSLWVVNDDYQPMEVVTLTDILSVITSYEDQ